MTKDRYTKQTSVAARREKQTDKQTTTNRWIKQTKPYAKQQTQINTTTASKLCAVRYCKTYQIRPFVCLSIRLSIRLAVCLSICLSVCQSVCLSVCLSVCSSVCQIFIFYMYELLQAIDTKVRYISIRPIRVSKNYQLRLHAIGH